MEESCQACSICLCFFLMAGCRVASYISVSSVEAELRILLLLRPEEEVARLQDTPYTVRFRA